MPFPILSFGQILVYLVLLTLVILPPLLVFLAWVGLPRALSE